MTTPLPVPSDPRIPALIEALEQYADPRNWAIRRNGSRYPDCIWIGPGSEEPVPNAIGLAREALAG